MSNDTSNLIGVRFNPEAIKLLDEKRAEIGATRQEFIKMAVYRTFSG